MLGMTVAQMREQMSQAEYVGWLGFFQWEHDQAEREGRRRGR